MKRNSRGLQAAVALTAVGTALFAAAPAAHAADAPTPAKTITAVQEKRAFWGSLHKGDCQQDNGTIVIRSDGTGDWSATTLTYQTHSGDVWHSNFEFYTTAGFKVLRVGQFDSPRMNDGNPPPRYSWGAHFVFNPADFNGIDINKTLQYSSC
jgi:hypothetical protein